MPEVLSMKLTETMNISYISYRVACAVKLNIKEIFLGNKCFAANVYLVNGLQSKNKIPITLQI